METKEARLFSYTRSERDAECNRAGYYAREWGGTGLSPKTQGWDLVFGNIIHKWLDHLAKTQGIPFQDVRANILTEATKVFDAPPARDWAALGEGMLRAFVRSVWPQWMAEYDVLEGESWIAYEVEPGFIYRHRRDLILKSKLDGHLSYREYKTTSTDRAEWIASFSKNVQVHTGMVLEKYVNGREIRDCVVQGLYKGYKDKKNKTQRSIFAQGYVNRQYPTVPDYSYKYQRSKGWESFATYDEFADLKQWVDEMPIEDLSAQLPRTGPIFPREDIVQKYFKQQLIRQKTIAEGVELLQKVFTVEEIDALLDKYFPQNFSQCQPAYGGFNCSYLPICWQKWVEADPLGSGLFERYDPSWETKLEVE